MPHNSDSDKFHKVSQPSYGLHIERLYIPMSDGVKLAATLYMPAGAEPEDHFPSLLEFLPYRKDDNTFLRDLPRYEYFAHRGYVGARVDLRGTGASEGVADDEYSEQEGKDALEVIAWLAQQPWSNGNVGMWGISYGGFNSIQVAMLHPPALKAIVPVDATDDVYTDDIVYWDGALQFESLGRWPLSMLSSNGLPGYPDYDVNSQATQDRFDNEPWVLQWLRQQRDGPYWRRMSLRPRYDAIEIPTLMIGGWLDGYTDSIPRMLEHMKAPTRAIIGPWPHTWPDEASPGPKIDYQYELLRWWDYWLKGIDTGIMDEPRVAIYVQHYYPPGTDVEEIPGEWRYEDEWPVARVQRVAWYPQPNGELAQDRSQDLVAELEYKATVGASNRYRVPHNPAELFSDQRADDVYSLTFTTAPLEEDIEIVGFPEVSLYVTSTAPLANWIVRLCDIAPDGSSQLVAKGILNGAHRDGHANPKPLEPGSVHELSFALKCTAWVFPKGHKIRLAISNADFPNIWPSPGLMTTTLHISEAQPSHIMLPVCPHAERPKPQFGAIESKSNQAATRSGPRNQWLVTRDEMQREVTVFRETLVDEYQIRTDEHSEITYSFYERRWCTARDAEPARATLRGEGQRMIRYKGNTITVQAELLIETDETHFHVTAGRKLSNNDIVVREQTWQETIPRDHL